MAVESTINPAHYVSAPIAGVPRSNRPVPIEAQIVKVYDKEGNVYEVQRHVASDYVRIRGWSLTSPKLRAAAVGVDDTVAGTGEGVAPVSANDAVVDDAGPNETDLALAHLEALREQAIGLGIKIDMRWGKRRLNDEIAAATA